MFNQALALVPRYSAQLERGRAFGQLATVKLGKLGNFGIAIVE